VNSPYRSTLSTRSIFLCVAVVLSIASVASAAYQKTKDGKTLVWNNHPDRGDEASWAGDRDERGYATGPGTLTWYRAAPKIVTGSNIPAPKGPVTFLSRLKGTMAGGKFEGVVEMVNAAGRSYHTVFVNGNSNDDWEIGPAPSPEKKSKARTKETAAAKAPVESPAPAAEATIKPRTKTEAAVAPTHSPESEAQSASAGLVSPPSALRDTPPAADASPKPEDQPLSSPMASTTPAVPPPAAASPEAEEEAVRTLLGAYAAGWENHDGHEMDKVMASDVNFTAADGTNLRGRAAVEKYHARHPNERFKDSESASRQAKVRFPKPDRAEVTWDWNMKAGLNPDGTVRPRRSGVMTMTAQKRNGAWLIVAARNASAEPNVSPTPETKP
jgi:uncharacterized protein (TIGR02246 family)